MVSFSRPNYRQLPVDMENQVALTRSIGQPRMQSQPTAVTFTNDDDLKINYRMRVTMADSRQLTGTLLAFDKVSLLPPRPLLSFPDFCLNIARST